ncbi:Hypothetical_protein [Hexamita inflata]|uniref:Hypothetical_protein n=1 Tax=Hexamita inflata TaxID=28002 RepID=A0AA86V4L3_9EUKA|nr:Hypothetical protein HINF_LOCUS63812 [Hexamita inflata]
MDELTQPRQFAPLARIQLEQTFSSTQTRTALELALDNNYDLSISDDQVTERPVSEQVKSTTNNKRSIELYRQIQENSTLLQKLNKKLIKLEAVIIKIYDKIEMMEEHENLLTNDIKNV